MKRLLPILFCLPISGLNAQTIHPSGIQGCVARYDFSSVLNSGTQLVDVSNNTHTGLVHNTYSTTGWRGYPNTAMGFDGYSSYIEVAHSPLLSPQTVTVIGLVRFDGFYNGNCQANTIVSKGFPHRVSGNYSLYATDQLYDDDCYAFTPSSEVIGASLSSINLLSGNLPTPIQSGQWYFTAVSYNGTNTSIYQQKMDSTAGQPTNIAPIYQLNNGIGSIGYNAMDLTIGRHMDPPYPYWFNGSMDEVAIFNRGLNQDEINRVYQYLWGNQAPSGIQITATPENSVHAHVENGTLFLKSTDNQPLGKVMMYNVTGQLLASGEYRERAEKVDINAYPLGVFFIKITRNGEITTLKVNKL